MKLKPKDFERESKRLETILSRTLKQSPKEFRLQKEDEDPILYERLREKYGQKRNLTYRKLQELRQIQQNSTTEKSWLGEKTEVSDPEMWEIIKKYVKEKIQK